MRLLLPLALATLAAGIDIKVLKNGGTKASTLEYGLMFEDINHSGDGGMLVIFFLPFEKVTNVGVAMLNSSKIELSKGMNTHHRRCIHGKHSVLPVFHCSTRPRHSQKHCRPLSK